MHRYCWTGRNQRKRLRKTQGLMGSNSSTRSKRWWRLVVRVSSPVPTSSTSPPETQLTWRDGRRTRCSPEEGTGCRQRRRRWICHRLLSPAKPLWLTSSLEGWMFLTWPPF
ncbi:hypothetical protein LINGRAHAP2_LOCUS33370 [Linum grandiflorum]